MKHIIAIVPMLLLHLVVNGQIKDVKKEVSKKEVEEHIYYIASDELQGRDVGTPGIDKAANYIIEQLKKYGVKPIEGEFKQPVPLVQSMPIDSGVLMIGDSAFQYYDNFIVLRRPDKKLSAPIVFANYGLSEDLEELDVKNKLVMVYAGAPGVNDPREWFKIIKSKAKMLDSLGAVGMVEIYHSRSIPWAILANYLSGQRFELKENSDHSFPVLWLDDPDKDIPLLIKDNKAIGRLALSGGLQKVITGKNIVGYIEGRDRKLKEEYIIVSAHYDHVGVGKPVKHDGQPADSVFNGARDNALGTAGLLMAAKYFAKHKPKRSILFLAFTAEEKGLLGSSWYVDHPLVPLNQCVFNMNIDAAGYNDTTMVTIFGLEKSKAESEIVAATEEAQLKAGYDPIPDQNIFRRSDHFSFAKKGIPSVLYGPGLTSFNEEITYYYHQVTDNPETLNYDYVTKVIQAFINTSAYLADRPKRPEWQDEEDEYKEAAEKLYGIEE